MVWQHFPDHVDPALVAEAVLHACTDAGLAPDVEAKIVRQTGALLYRLHQIRVAGFGTLQDGEYVRTGWVRGEHGSAGPSLGAVLS